MEEYSPLEYNLLSKCHEMITETTLAGVALGDTGDPSEDESALLAAVDSLFQYHEEVYSEVKNIKMVHWRYIAYLLAMTKKREYEASMVKYATTVHTIRCIYSDIMTGACDKDALISFPI